MSLRREIQELDTVRLKINMRSEGLQKGDCGRVVMLYGNPVKDADVEFADFRTGGIMLVMVPIKWLEVIEEEEEEENSDDFTEIV